MKALSLAWPRSDRCLASTGAHGSATWPRRFLLTMTLLVGYVPSAVHADTLSSPASGAWQQEASLVRDWMTEESRRARPDTVEKSPAANGKAEGVAPKRLPPRVRAVYGTHPDYTIWLEVDGRLRHYRPGASLPLNARNDSREYRLVKVVDRCVVLRPVNGGRNHTVCYQASTAQNPLRSQHLLDQPLPGVWAER